MNKDWRVRIGVCLLLVPLLSCGSGGTKAVVDSGLLLPDSVPNDGANGTDGADAKADGKDLLPRAETDGGGAPIGCGAGGLECGTWVLDGKTVHCGVCPAEETRGGNGGGQDAGDAGNAGSGPFCSSEGTCGPAPDCTQDQFRVTELLLGENVDTLSVPWVGPVQPGVRIPFILGWSGGNSDGCNECERQFALGVEGGLPACTAGRVLPTCPDLASGHDIGELLAPTKPGTYTLLAELSPSSGCGGESHPLGWDFTAQVVGKLVVGEPCAPVDCTGLSASCGLHDDSCGGKVWCGACGAGELCSELGQCETAPACTLDILEIDSVLINGFSNTAQVAAGEPVLLIFSYSLGSKTELDGEGRQIVLGVDGAPASCTEIGVPPTCPDTAPGLGSAKFAAPPSGGPHLVNLVVAAKDNCAAATAEFPGAMPKTAIGTLHVLGACQPATCTGLGAQCGYLDDGCGEHLNCGGCPGEQSCNALGKCGPPDCQMGMFSVQDVEVGGPGNKTSAAPGGLVPVVVDWKAGNLSVCPSCPMQLVLGFAGKSGGCFDLGVLPLCPQAATGSIGTFVTAPEAPGEHVLLGTALHEENCTEAVSVFGQAAVQAASFPIGTVVVEGTCLPAGCGALGKECGEWGDGCGGILHCGMCAGGTTCTGQGQCDSPCKQGVFEVTGIGIAGSGKAGSAPAGKVTSVSINWELGNPEGCSDCKRQVVVGVGDEACFCVEIDVPPACPKVGAGAKTGTVVAPEQEGIHTVYALASTASDCPEAMDEYAKNPARKAVGTLYSVIGCTPASCAQQGTSCGPKVDFCGQTLDCGTCAAGLLCMPVGKCQCSAQDPYEPNNAPSTTFHLGNFTDKDLESTNHVKAAVEEEEDWFSVGASDVQWAFMEPFVEVSLGLAEPFEVIMAYVCLSGTTSEAYTLIDGQGCTLESGLDVQLPGVTGPVSGFRCQGKGAPVFVQFGPECPGVDDSGTLYVGVKKTGQCSAYELDLHL